MDDLLDKRQVCRMLGGINQSTLWRWVRTNRWPRPIHVGPQVRRWSRQECEAALQRMLEAR